MTEDVDEQSAFRPQPTCDAAQQFLVVPEVFEHFDRQDAVEALLGREFADVGRDDGDVRTPKFGRSPLNELPLHGRVRNGQHSAARVMLGNPECQRAPAATEIKHLHAFGDTHVRASISSSASFRDIRGLGHRQQLYFSRRPRTV
jgi:hypothetical protein